MTNLPEALKLEEQLEDPTNRKLAMQDINCEIDEYGNKKWYQHGKLHREDGPAVEYADGFKELYQHGKLHRSDGPAIEFIDGHKEWGVEGQQHRVDGPRLKT